MNQVLFCLVPTVGTLKHFDFIKSTNCLKVKQERWRTISNSTTYTQVKQEKWRTISNSTIVFFYKFKLSTKVKQEKCLTLVTQLSATNYIMPDMFATQNYYADHTTGDGI